MKIKSIVCMGFLLVILGPLPIPAFSQNTAFTYQGTLNSGGIVANGTFDFQFAMFDAASNGNVVVGPITNFAVSVSNGLFTTSPDFGAGAFNGSPRWLQISVRTNGSGGVFASLLPLQPVTSAPYAIQAVNASNAINAALAQTAVTASSVAANGVVPLTALPGAVVTNGSANLTLAGVFTGIGAGLTNLSGSSITGTIPDSSLSTNVPLLNGVDKFSSIVAARYLAGDGSGISNISLASLPNLAVTQGAFVQTNTYASAGTYNVTVPAGAGYMVAKLWGAGGGGYAGTGGGGAYVQKTLTVLPGQVYTVVVGQYGGSLVNGGAGTGGQGSGNAQGGSGTYAGHGGQASSLFLFTGSSYIMKAVAGAGGGASAGSSAINGGGGGNPGQDGVTYINSYNAGGGGGGYGYGGSDGGGNYSFNALTLGETNLDLMGGNGGDGMNGGPGGGGGYGGGGGGINNGAGGGGGSYGDVIVGATSPTPGNIADPFYIFPAGYGGPGNGYHDGNGGLVVVLFAFQNVQLSGVLSANGSGLSNLNASQLSAGTVPLAQLPGAVVTNNASGLNLSGSFRIWQTVSGTAQTGQPNTGYLLTNDGLGTFTLPANPNAGDVIRVADSGGSGWRLAQNAGQSIIAKNLSGNSWPVWTARDTTRAWRSIAGSADGTKLVATVDLLQIYTSANSGVSWAACTNAPTTNWFAVACSSDGAKLVALGHNGLIYTSANSGVTWILRSGALPFSSYWQSVASSSDGTKLVAVAQDQQVYTSTNSGTNWTAHNYTPNWMAVASSADGTRLVGVTYYGQLPYTSSDSGNTWTAQGNAGGLNRVAVACSADGLKIVMGGFSGPVQTSSDGGVSWVTTGLTNAYWVAFASSADFTRLAAVQSTGVIYTSGDSGATWTLQNAAGSRNWEAIASSASGTKLAATVTGGQVFTSVLATTPGTLGYLLGDQYSAVELQYIGNGQWLPVSHEGTIQAY